MLTVARLSKYDLWRESLGLGRLQECIYGVPLAPDNVTDGRHSIAQLNLEHGLAPWNMH